MPEETKIGSGGGAGVATYQPPPTEPSEPVEPQAAEPTTEKEAPKIKLPASIKPPTKTGRFTGRISELVGQRDAAARERDQLKEQISKMSGLSRTTKDGTEQTDAEGGTPLSPENYETYADYVKALVKATIDKNSESEKSNRANAAYQAHREERQSIFNEQAAPLAEAYGEGFWDSITDPSLPVSEAMADAVMELDDLGPYIMLYLAAHRDESLKMAKMNPRAATVSIGKLAARLDYEIKQGGESGAAVAGSGESAGASGTGPGQLPTPPQNQAAPKPSPVPVPRGSGVNAGDAAPKDTDSVEEWLRKETIRLRGRNPLLKFYGAR